MRADLRPLPAPPAIERVRALVEPALRDELERIPDPRMRRIAGYQLGWWDADGTPTPGAGGKAIRPTLAVLAAEAAGGRPESGIPVAVALEFVHNFSLLHDDIMDRDVERRHRPTGWVAFGEGQAILAGNALLVAAMQAVQRAEGSAARTQPMLLDAAQRLIAGQSADLDLERRIDVDLAAVLDMERGKTAALFSAALGAGALAGGADDAAAARLQEAGERLGIAFQLVDDLLGVAGDPAVTGKSASSDVRAGKSSAPIIAALRGTGPAAAELRERLAAGVPESEDEVARIGALIEQAGGLAWAADEADRLLDAALDALSAARLPNAAAVEQIGQVARYLVMRDR